MQNSTGSPKVEILRLHSPLLKGVVSSTCIQALFASGALTVEYVCILLFVHITNTPDFAAAPLPSLQSLASLQPRQGDTRISKLRGVLTATAPAVCCADMSRSLMAQEMVENRSRCRSCGELLSTCFSCRSVTTATLQLLLAAIHRQRHQAPLLAYMSAKQAGPSILFSAASTILGEVLCPECITPAPRQFSPALLFFPVVVIPSLFRFYLSPCPHICLTAGVGLLMFAKSDSFRIFCLANLLVIGAAVVTTCCCAPLLLIYIQPLLPKPKAQKGRSLRSASRIVQNNANYSC